MVPSTLAGAHEELKAAFAKAMGQYKKRLGFGDVAGVREKVERFVDELCRVPDWAAELQRRAALVEESCKEGSEFYHALVEVLRDCPEPSKRTPLEEPYWQLRDLKTSHEQKIMRLPATAAEVEQWHGVIEQAVSGGRVDDRLKPRFDQLISQCQRIRHDAKGVEADGCHYLWHIYRASKPDAPTRSSCIRRMFEGGDVGGAYLGPMLAAADMLTRRFAS